MPVIWGRAEVADRWRGRRRRRTRRRRRRMASPALQILLFWNISDLSGLKTGLKIIEILSQPPVQTSPQLTHLLFLVAKVVFNLKSEEGGRWRVLFDLIFNYLIPFILYQKLDKLDFVSLKVWKITSCSSELCVSRLGKTVQLSILLILTTVTIYLHVLQLHLELLHLGLELVLIGAVATTQLVQVRALPPHLIGIIRMKKHNNDPWIKIQMYLFWKTPIMPEITSFSRFSSSSFSISMILLSLSLSREQ